MTYDGHDSQKKEVGECAFKQYCDQHAGNMDRINSLFSIVNQHKGQWLLLGGFGLVLLTFSTMMYNQTVDIRKSVTKLDKVITTHIVQGKAVQDENERACQVTRELAEKNAIAIEKLTTAINALRRHAE